MQNIGYYSLIQYCPNPLRLEAVNVGLVVFVPELRFIETRINTSNERVRKLFGTTFDNNWLNLAKNSIKERIEKVKKDFCDLKDFEKFINTRMNEVLLTQPKLVKVENPEELLTSLFKELVEYKRKKEDPGPIIRELDKAFRSPGLKEHIEFNISFKIPALDRKIKAPYAYQNGAYNIIKPELFTDKKYIDKASLLAMEGRFIKRSENPTQLVVVPEIQCSKKRNVLNSLKEIFAEANVRAILPDERSKFIAEVKKGVY